MPRLYIPSLGDKLTLSQDWRFNLIQEYRNDTLVEHLTGLGAISAPMDSVGPFLRPIVSYEACLPKGVVLTIDRIFIRKGAEDFDSITFLLDGAKTKARVVSKTAVSVGEGTRESWEYSKKLPARPVRFWVKLTEANSLEFD